MIKNTIFLILIGVLVGLNQVVGLLLLVEHLFLDFLFFVGVHWLSLLEVLDLLFSDESKVDYSLVIVYIGRLLKLEDGGQFLLVLLEVGVDHVLSDVSTSPAHEHFVKDKHDHLEDVPVLVLSNDHVDQSERVVGKHNEFVCFSMLLHHEWGSLDDSLESVVGRDNDHSWVGEQEWNPYVFRSVFWPVAVSEHTEEQDDVKRNEQRIEEELKVDV